MVYYFYTRSKLLKIVFWMKLWEGRELLLSTVRERKVKEGKHAELIT